MRVPRSARYRSIWVTYDPAIWNAAQWVDGTNQANEAIQALFHKTAPSCSLHDNLGHGVPTTWTWATYTRDIGGVIFQIDQWTETIDQQPGIGDLPVPIRSTDRYIETTRTGTRYGTL